LDGRRPKSETIPLSGRTCWQSRHLRAGSPGAFIAIGPSCRFACPEGRCICRLPFVRRRECSMSPAGDRAARARLTAYASDVRVGGAGLLPWAFIPVAFRGVINSAHFPVARGYRLGTARVPGHQSITWETRRMCNTVVLRNRSGRDHAVGERFNFFPDTEAFLAVEVLADSVVTQHFLHRINVVRRQLAPPATPAILR